MEIKVKLSSKGQMVLPKVVRERLNLHPGDEALLIVEEEGVRLVPLRRRSLAEVLERLPGHRPHLPEDEDLLEAEATSARERWHQDVD